MASMLPVTLKMYFMNRDCTKLTKSWYLSKIMITGAKYLSHHTLLSNMHHDNRGKVLVSPHLAIKLVEGTHTICFSSSFYIINQKNVIPGTDFQPHGLYIVHAFLFCGFVFTNQMVLLLNVNI